MARTQGESGPPKAIIAKSFFAAEIGRTPFQLSRKILARLISLYATVLRHVDVMISKLRVVSRNPRKFCHTEKLILRIPATSSDSNQAIGSDTNPPVVNVGFSEWRIVAIDP